MEDAQNANSSAEKEIDLRDLFDKIAKKWRLVFGITMIAGIAALALSLAVPKTYEVRTVLEVGTAPDQSQLNSIEDPAEVAKKIDGDFYGDGVRQKLGLSESNYPKLKVDNFSGNFISVSMASSRVQRAVSILKELDSAVIKDYESRSAKKKAVIAADIDVLKKDIVRLTNKVNSTQSEKKDIDTEISTLNNEVTYNRDIGLILALTSDRRLLETKQQDIESLYLQINQNNQQINAMNGLLDQMRPTAVTAEPVVSQASASPKVTLTTVIGVLLGFFAGIALVLGMDWWNKKA